MSKVTIRRKPITRGRHTIYLDYYPPIKNPETGELTRWEYLKLYTYDTPRLDVDRKHNRETNTLVEFIRAQRQLEVQNRRFGFLSDAKRDANFVDFFKVMVRKKQKTDSDNYAMGFRYFVAFVGHNLRFSDLNDYLCEDYKHFLLSEPGISRRGKAISRNTAVSYFAKFRTVLKEAFKRGLITTNLYEAIDPIEPKETHRERLEIEEFQLLASTPANSDLIKRACLFAGLTGLRFSDVQTLLWSEVRGVPGKYHLQFIQEKTEGAEVLPISDQAVELMGERGAGEERVFKDLKYSSLKSFFVNWLNKAEIVKNITFHSFRHTYATLQLEFGTDLYTVSKMLGHKSIKTTQIYAKVVDKNKQEATSRIRLNLD